MAIMSSHIKDTLNTTGETKTDEALILNFFEAVRKNELKLVKELLEKEPKLIEARDKEGFTAFMQVCFEGGSTDMLDLLISINPEVQDQTVFYIKDSSHENIFWGHIGIGLAVARNQLNIVKHLYQKSSWKERLWYPYPGTYPKTNCYTLFHLAAKFGHRAILEYLHPTDSRLSRMSFTHYYSMSHENGDAFTEAMDNGHLDVIKYLLSIHPLGTECWAANGYLIYKAVKSDSFPIVKYMVESNLKHFHDLESNIPSMSDFPGSLVTHAAAYDKIENVKYLLSIGANIDKCYGEVPYVRYGGTCKDPKIIEIINDCKTLVAHFRRYSWQMPTLKEVKASLDKVCTVNFTTREGTLLHLALGDNSYFAKTQEMIMLIFESGIDRNIKNKDGLTALEYGVKNGRIQVIANLFKQSIEKIKNDEKLKEEEQQIRIQALQDEFDSLLQFADKSEININYHELIDAHGLMFFEPFANQTVSNLLKGKQDGKSLSSLAELSDLLYVGQLKATITSGKPTFEVVMPDSHQSIETKEKESENSKENQTSRVLNLKLALAYAIRSENIKAIIHAGTALLGLDLDPIRMHTLKTSCKSFMDAIFYLLSGEANKKAQVALKPEKLVKAVKTEKAKKPKSESSLSLDDDEGESTELKVLSEDDKTEGLITEFRLGISFLYVQNMSASTFLERYCALHKIESKDPSILAMLNQKPLHEGFNPFETLIINILERERNLILKEKQSLERPEGPERPESSKNTEGSKDPESLDFEMPSSGFTPGFTATTSKTGAESDVKAKEKSTSVNKL